MDLILLGAGAAKGLVEALRTAFHDETGAGINGSFGAAGAIREQFLAAPSCDVLILPEVMLGELAQRGEVRRDSVAPLGRARATEIPDAPSVAPAGPPPVEIEVPMMYSAAVGSRARHPELARRLVDMLVGPTAARLRQAGGFSPDRR